MKKYNRFLSFLLFFCIISPTFTTYGATIIGKAVNTDIVAYINDLPIPSYNIDGQTAIVAEDLNQYGFRVHYWEEYRLLQLDYVPTDNVKITADYTPKKNTKPIGSFAANVYQTDITTTLRGDEIPSFNIGGKTLIFIDALKKYGDVIWYPEEREIRFTYVPNWKLEVPNDYTKDTSASISYFVLELTRDETGEFVVSGENEQYITYVSFWGGKSPVGFQFSLYQNVNLQTSDVAHLLNQMLNADREEWIADDTTFANEHMKVFINEEPVSILSVTGGGGNGHTDYSFSLDKNIRKLEEIQSIRLECR